MRHIFDSSITKNREPQPGLKMAIRKMKTSIYISGQINGNFKLRNAIVTADCEEKKGMFNSIEIIFSTKKAAVKALSNAYQSFVRNGERRGVGGITYSRGYSLGYDASTAKITE